MFWRKCNQNKEIHKIWQVPNHLNQKMNLDHQQARFAVIYRFLHNHWFNFFRSHVSWFLNFLQSIPIHCVPGLRPVPTQNTLWVHASLDTTCHILVHVLQTCIYREINYPKMHGASISTFPSVRRPLKFHSAAACFPFLKRYTCPPGTENCSSVIERMELQEQSPSFLISIRTGFCQISAVRCISALSDDRHIIIPSSTMFSIRKRCRWPCTCGSSRSVLHFLFPKNSL